MSCVVEVDLERLASNASRLVALTGRRRVGITAVTKAVLGHPEVARAVLGAGVTRLGDSRVENLERMRAAGIGAWMLLIRTPAPSEVDRVVAVADASCNTELDVMTMLSVAAGRRGCVHGVILMVELGDLREGLMPSALAATVSELLTFPHLRLLGLGTNLACRNGVIPDQAKMDELSLLAEKVEADFGLELDIVSGGNSANLSWLGGAHDAGRINDLRLGESMLLGRDPLDRSAIEGMHTDVFSLVAEVIESKLKPAMPWGRRAEAAFGAPQDCGDPTEGDRWQTIVAVGHQDTDPSGLTPPAGFTMLGASSDHLVLQSPGRVQVGERLRFAPNYSALLRSMTSSSVEVTTRVVAAVGGARSGKDGP